MESGERRVPIKQNMGSILRDKSFAFAVSIIRLGDNLDASRQYTLKDQIVRSGTSIGANVREAKNAQGPKDMISKLSIALKEADETEYWLDLLNESSKISQDEYSTMKSNLNEIISMLVSSIKTLKERNN